MLGATLQGWDEKNKDALPGQEMVFRNFPFFFFLTLNRRRGGGGAVTMTCIASECGDYGCTLSSYAFPGEL